MNKNLFWIALFAVALTGCKTTAPAPSAAASPAVKPGYKDTPMLPSGWHVHDPDRPQPVVVTPGTFSSQKKPGQPPSDALELFNGHDLSQWRDKDGKTPIWKIDGDEMTVGKGEIVTRQEFGDIQLHVEFTTPYLPTNTSQGRANSGIFLMGRFEVQVLDCYQNITYPDGATGAMYGQRPPLVNAVRPPGEWQTYDIVFTTPRFSGNELKKPAYVTIFLNGVLVQNHEAYLGPTGHRRLANYNTPIPATGPISLQDHGDKVRYRNIWLRPLKFEDEP